MPPSDPARTPIVDRLRCHTRMPPSAAARSPLFQWRRPRPGPRQPEELILALLAVLPIALYIWGALSRVWFPFELEWMEGAIWQQVRAVAQGLPLYSAPSPEQVGLIYPPLYFWLGNLAWSLLGEGFGALRLISFGSSLIVFGLLFQIVRRETGLTLDGLLAAGLFAACYPASGAWLDLARVDSLFLALILGGFYLARRAWGFGRSAAAGLCFLLAAATKQTAVIIWAPTVTLLFWTRPGVRLGLILGLVLPGIAFFFAIYSQEWWWFYLVELPAGHAIRPGMLLGFWARDLWGVLPVAFVLASATLLMGRGRFGEGGWTFLMAATLGLMAGSWASRIHSGGFLNCLIPAFAALAVLAPLGRRILEPSGNSGKAKMGRGSLALLFSLQIAGLLWNPANTIPTEQDRATMTAIHQWILKSQQPVFVPYHPYLMVIDTSEARRQGEEPEKTLGRKHRPTTGIFAHDMAMSDLLRAGSPEAAELESRLRRILAERRFGWILLDETRPFQYQNWFDDLLEACYKPVGPIVTDKEGLWMKGGMETRPALLYEPRESAAKCADAPSPGTNTDQGR